MKTCIGWAVALLLGSLFSTSPLQASQGLYCLSSLSGKHCNYQSLTACMQAAGKHGQCYLNRYGMLKPQGGAPFCIAERWRIQCTYPNMQSCQVQARARRAQCVPNPNYQ
uniref:DUF3551 domain-containing protein n=1 Tax=Magnetococcus massalia (strain MO-1) TaxID=451514 RepID=A0A1S7LLV4_MAGMO|nr:Conserved exported protein of unknown function [Candidatus Magnetococcus massalia]